MQTFKISVLFVILMSSFIFAANWSQTTLGYGNVRSICFVGSKVYASIDSTGIGSSADHGSTWNIGKTGLPANSIINSLAANGSNLYASVADPEINNYPAGVFVSLNSGSNWSTVNTGLVGFGRASSWVSKLFASGTYLLAATFGVGVYRSDDGTSWTSSNIGIDTQAIYGLAMTKTGLVLAITHEKVFYSLNSGRNWSAFGVTGLLPSPGIEDIETIDDKIFIATSDGVFTSTFAIRNWTLVSPDITFTDQLAVSGSSLFMSDMITEIVYISNNFGTTWQTLEAATGNYGLSALPRTGIISTIAADQQYVYAGIYNKGLWRFPIAGLSARNTFNNALSQAVSIKKADSPKQQLVFDFHLRHAGKVKVEIMTLSGAKIATIIDDNISLGTHSISWPTEMMTRGCFMVKVQIDSDVCYQRILL